MASLRGGVCLVRVWMLEDGLDENLVRWLPARGDRNRAMVPCLAVSDDKDIAMGDCLGSSTEESKLESKKLRQCYSHA